MFTRHAYLHLVPRGFVCNGGGRFKAMQTNEISIPLHLKRAPSHEVTDMSELYPQMGRPAEMLSHCSMPAIK